MHLNHISHALFPSLALSHPFGNTHSPIPLFPSLIFFCCFIAHITMPCSLTRSQDTPCHAIPFHAKSHHATRSHDMTSYGAVKQTMTESFLMQQNMAGHCTIFIRPCYYLLICCCMGVFISGLIYFCSASNWGHVLHRKRKPVSAKWLGLASGALLCMALQ